MNTDMQKMHQLFASVLVVLAIAGVVLYVLFRPVVNSEPHEYPTFTFTPLSTSTSESIPETQLVSELVPPPQHVQTKIKTTPGVERWYTNPTLKFSFRLPDGFSAPDIATGVQNVYGVAVYNSAGSRLIVLANPIAAGTSLNESVIRTNLPDVRISDVREAHIGTAVRGLMFRTDAPEWGGDGIAFWAAYNGYVYQFAAARTDQDLMDFVMQHWFFAPPTPSPPSK